MKKIGLVIQYDGVNNYGTVLQAFATVKVIENLGCKPILIKYVKKYTLGYVIQQIPRIFEPVNWSSWLRVKNRKKRRNENPEYVLFGDAARSAFKEFRLRRFNTIKTAQFNGYDELRRGSREFDSVLVGSDQLWLPAGLKSNYYNLDFVTDDIPRISYATSFGVSKIPENQIKATAKYLNRIDYLSVREQSGVDIIKELTGRDAYLACDPTMLLDSNEWSKEIEKYSIPEDIKEPYLVTYFLGGNENARSQATLAAKKLGVKIVAIKHMEDFFSIDDEFGDYSPRGLSPEQFVSLIKNAEYVMTDSFHGTSFSIIFEKKFLVFYRFSDNAKYSKNTRIDNILSRFGISDRLYRDGDAFEIIAQPIDYNRVSALREKWKEESYEFLRNAIGEDND